MINRHFESLQTYFLQKLKLVSSTYFIWILLLSLVKLFLVSFQQMSALTQTVHDDALFIRMAYSLSSGKWLGFYNSFTLIKGPIYPMFISVVNFVGFPVLFSQHLLHIFASLLLVKALAPIIRDTKWEIILFAVLLFNPTTTDVFTTRILRDAFYVSLSIMMVAAFVGLYLRRHRELHTLIRWSIFAGIILFLQQNTREEGIVFMPILLFLSVLTLLSFFNEERKKWSFFSIILIPYFILIAGNLSLATINYAVYGSFLRNEIKSKNFTDSYAALSKIDSRKWMMNIPVSYEARKKAYQVSPAFSELEQYMEGEGNGFLQYSGIEHEILGAHFIWALRYAAEAAGYHENLPKSQQYYAHIAKELNEAFENGVLEKKQGFSMFNFTWDNRLFMPTLQKFGDIVLFVSSFDGYKPKSWVSSGDYKEIARFQNMTNEIACITEFTQMEQTLSSNLKMYSLKFIASIYRFLNPIIGLFSIVIFGILSLLMLLKNLHKQVQDLWLLSLVFLMLALSRMALIALISVTQWDAMNMHYLSASYPFLLVFEFLALYSTVKFLKNHRLEK